MCGIVGIYNYKSDIQDKKSYISRCLETMKHRGPDSNGIWGVGNYITGFVRLAIRDLSPLGNQPMVSDCGQYCITFNGEIYNAEIFVEKLKKFNVNLKSTTDTEILLYSLIHFGRDYVLNEFDGMFAFAFFDVQKDELLLARDRIGIKPLYIGYNKNEEVIYSSQYNHIIQYGNILNEELDYGAIGSFLQLGYMAPGPGVVKNTQLLPHGHYAVIDSKGINIKQYYFYSSNISEVQEQNFPFDENLIASSVNEQLISDVPIGTFLSGGVDSSLITIEANKINRIDAFTIGTDDKYTDEKNEASWFAKKFNINHHVKTITEKDLLDTLDDNFKAYTEPFADFSSIPTLLVSKYAAEYVKVVLSGDGPDELFWGYQRNLKMIDKGQVFNKSIVFKGIDFLLSKLKIKSSKVDRRMLFSSSYVDYYYKSLFTFGGEYWINRIYRQNASESFFQKKIKHLYANSKSQNLASIARDLEMNIHLQRILIKVDKASMFHSIESRVPYLSNKMLEKSIYCTFNNCVVNGIGKFNIKKILAKSTGDDFVFKEKKGFLVPMHKWLRSVLKDDISTCILNMPAELEVAFNKKELECILNAHLNEGKDYSGIIWAVYSLVKWHQYHRK